MESWEILIKLYDLSGLDGEQQLALKSGISESYCYKITALGKESKGKTSKPPLIGLQLARAWVKASKPVDQDKLDEWLSLSMQLLFDSEDLEAVASERSAVNTTYPGLNWLKQLIPDILLDALRK